MKKQIYQLPTFEPELQIKNKHLLKNKIKINIIFT